MGNWNLPPGVTDNMLPGNRPGDAEWERFIEWLQDCGQSPAWIKWWVKEGMQNNIHMDACLCPDCVDE